MARIRRPTGGGSTGGTGIRGWTSITSCPVGGVDLFLCYRIGDGHAASIYLDEDGAVVIQETLAMSAGWAHIAYSGNRIFFHNPEARVTSFGQFHVFGQFKQEYSDPSGLFPQQGFDRAVSDGHKLCFYHAASGDIIVGYIGLLPAPGGGFSYNFVRDSAFLRQVLPQATHVATSRGITLFYRATDGEHEGVVFTPDGYALEDFITTAVKTPVHFGAGWTGLAGTGRHFFFYESDTGRAMIGYFSIGRMEFVRTAEYPAGTFAINRDVVVGGEEHIILHNSRSAHGETGYIDHDGRFVPQQRYEG